MTRAIDKSQRLLHPRYDPRLVALVWRGVDLILDFLLAHQARREQRQIYRWMQKIQKVAALRWSTMSDPRRSLKRVRSSSGKS